MEITWHVTVILCQLHRSHIQKLLCPGAWTTLPPAFIRTALKAAISHMRDLPETAHPNSCVCPRRGVSFPCQPRIALLFLASVPFVHSAPMLMQQETQGLRELPHYRFSLALPVGEYVLYPFLLTGKLLPLTQSLGGLGVTNLEDVFLFSEVASILRQYLFTLWQTHIYLFF